MTAILDDPTIQAIQAALLVRVKKRGYYKDSETGERYASVTTILGRTIAKPALVPWSANTVARCAMDNLPYLARSSRTDADRVDAYDWLRGAADRKKDERADVGSAVHALIENRILGTPLPPEVRNNPELAPYMRNFEAFVNDWKITFTASEMIVGSQSHHYAGTLDWLMTSPLVARQFEIDPDVQISGDNKTGGELDVKGVYPEAALQMAAYGHAEFAQLRDGSRVPMPAVADMGVVLHLRPEGYRLIPVNVGPQVFEAFLRLRDLDAQWVTALSKTVISPALSVPTESSVA